MIFIIQKRKEVVRFMPLKTTSIDNSDKTIEWILNMTNGKYDEPIQKHPNKKACIKRIFIDLVFWLFSYLVSLLFIVFPYFVQPNAQIDQLLEMVLKNYAIPVLAITTSVTTIADVLKNRSTKISRGVLTYHFSFVIICMFIYTAYFIGTKTQSSNMALDNSYICSIVVIIGSLIGELAFVIKGRKEEL